MSFGPRLNEIFDARRVKLVAFAQQRAGECLRYMQDLQRNDGVWDNQTYQALQGLFTGLIDELDAAGFFTAHTMDYGVFLELANDRKYELLRPSLERFATALILYAKELYS